MIGLLILMVMSMFVYAGIQSFKQSSLNSAAQVIGAYMKENEEMEQRKAEMLNEQNRLIDELKTIDANFSFTSFQRLVASTSCWAMEAKSTNAKEVIAQLRKYASASFLNDYVHDIEKVSQIKQCTYRNVCLEEMIMKEVKQQDEYDVIIVEAMVRYDYATYQNDRLLRQKEMKSKLELTYTKKKERIGINQEYEAMTHCPNCGAPIDVIHDEKCAYCDSYYYAKSNIWMLHELREYQQALYGLS